jgi:hypothetical protein
LLRKLFCMFGISTALVCSIAQAETINLTTAGASGSATAVVGGTYQVQQIDSQSTGTGVIDPFLRLQANGNNDSEMGYNTDATPEYDAKGGGFTTALLLSDVPIVNGSYQFLLDVNQTNNNPLLSLNQIQIFRAAADVGTGNETISGTAPPVISFGSAATEVFRMSGAGALLDEILLNYDLNPGSGAGDMFLYIPVATFAAATGDYVVFFSQFGTPPGANGTNDGVEEWAVLRGSTTPGPVPEPSSIVLLTSVIAGVGYSLRNRFRQQV